MQIRAQGQPLFEHQDSTTRERASCARRISVWEPRIEARDSPQWRSTRAAQERLSLRSVRTEAEISAKGPIPLSHLHEPATPPMVGISRPANHQCGPLGSRTSHPLDKSFLRFISQGTDRVHQLSEHLAKVSRPLFRALRELGKRLLLRGLTTQDGSDKNQR